MTKYAVKISGQGQITLPKALRDKLGANKGGRVILYIDNETSDIKVSNKFPIENYFGKFGNTISSGVDATDYVKKMRTADITKREKQ